jgi:hypothetical protein
VYGIPNAQDKYNAKCETSLVHRAALRHKDIEKKVFAEAVAVPKVRTNWLGETQRYAKMVLGDKCQFLLSYVPLTGALFLFDENWGIRAKVWPIIEVKQHEVMCNSKVKVVLTEDKDNASIIIDVSHGEKKLANAVIRPYELINGAKTELRSNFSILGYSDPDEKKLLDLVMESLYNVKLTQGQDISQETKPEDLYVEPTKAPENDLVVNSAAKSDKIAIDSTNKVAEQTCWYVQLFKVCLWKGIYANGCIETVHFQRV